MPLLKYWLFTWNIRNKFINHWVRSLSIWEWFFATITDRKEEVNQYRSNVSLLPVDCSLSFTESFATKKGENYRPQLLNSTDPEKRNPQVQMLYGLFKQIGQYGNNTIIRNADFLLSKQKKKTWDFTLGRCK